MTSRVRALISVAVLLSACSSVRGTPDHRGMLDIKCETAAEIVHFEKPTSVHGVLFRESYEPPFEHDYGYAEKTDIGSSAARRAELVLGQKSEAAKLSRKKLENWYRQYRGYRANEKDTVVVVNLIDPEAMPNTSDLCHWYSPFEEPDEFTFTVRQVNITDRALDD